MNFLILSLLATAGTVLSLEPECTVDNLGVTLTPEAAICPDVTPSATCDLIFAATSPGTPAAGGGTTREAKCESDPALKKLAIEQCPKYCGFCCMTPEYKCTNKPYSQTGLNCTTMADKCKDTTWRPLIAENCPATCGMCLEGGCIDKAPDCASQQTICFNVNFIDWAKENCARTCNQCPPLGAATTAAAGATTAAPGGVAPAPATTKAPAAACVNLDVNCDNWARNGKFCNNTWYQDQWYKCTKACGKC